jgi:hypothetical protein
MESNQLPGGLRRRLLMAIALAAVGAPAVVRAASPGAPAAPVVQVWKSPDCGCCGDWVVHLERNGFRVVVHDVGNVAMMRERLGMPARFGSCHTATVGGYVLEGHVPAREVHRLLKEQPAAIGLAVPGMPVGSPGMDGDIYGGRKDPYDVLLVQRDGGARAFESYR